MHLQYIHDKNTYDEMFTIHDDGLTSHCKLMLDQINSLIETGQKGLFFSHDVFCKNSLPIPVQTLHNKYDVHWCDIGEGEAKVSYDLIVFFGTFSVIEFDIPLLWRTFVVPKLTPVVFYTTESWRGIKQLEILEPIEPFERVEYDEIVPRIRLEVSGESAVKPSNVPSSSGVVPVGSPNVSIPDSHESPEIKSVETPQDKLSTNTMPTKQMPPPKKSIQEQHPTVTEKKSDETSQDNLALRRKIKRLKNARIPIRKIAEELKIEKGKVEWLLKRKPSQLNKTKTHK